MVIALVGNKADLVEEDDRLKGYGKFENLRHNYTNLVLDTEEDNENSHDKYRSRDQKLYK